MTASAPRVIEVWNAPELYAAVNTPANAGAVVQMGPGYYPLDPAMPNGGRLELQENMTLRGIPDQPHLVVIDAVNLPTGSTLAGAMRTGPIRVGRGSTVIEGLTVNNDLFGAGLIEVDLTPTLLPTGFRLSHAILENGQRGVDFRLLSSLHSGRTASVVIEHSEIRSITNGMSQGVRLLINGPTSATIVATLNGNVLTGNQVGMLAANQRQGNTIQITSTANTFTGNRAGCWLMGGLLGTSSGNALEFTSWNDAFRDNTLAATNATYTTGGGIVALAGAGSAVNNRARIELYGGTYENNDGRDVQLFGYYDLTPNTPVGAGNVLDWRGENVVPLVADSVPAEAVGVHTNLVRALPSVLGPADVWLGLKNSDAVGTKFDVRVEVLDGAGMVIASGQLTDVPGGSSGFNNARLRTVPLSLQRFPDTSTGQALRVRVFVRIAASSGHRSGTARLWFNDASANSRIGTAFNDTPAPYFFVAGGTLTTTTGTGPRLFADATVSRANGNPFTLLGEWTVIF